MDFDDHIKSALDSVESSMEEDLRGEDPVVYGILWPYISRGGKRIRPALSLITASALGANPEDLVEPASIIELFHNFTLIHDDIEDGSQYRRGEPTLHISHGIATALNSGDALYTLIWKKITGLSSDEKLQKLYVDGFKEVVDGQGHEIHWIQASKFDVTEEEYLHMIRGKTAALMGLSCEVGAYFSKPEYRKALRAYGENLGLAFQIQDDVLNLTGDFEKYKKEIGGDITEGKRTLIIVHALRNSGNRERLMDILKSKDPSLIDEAIAILEESGSIEYARGYARNLVEKAKKYLAEVPDSPDKATLVKIADYVVNREL